MEKIKKLRKLLKNLNLDGYIVPKNDEFFCEYVPENKDRLKYISGFTGSFGLGLILKNENYLLVDGRYSLQAKLQCGKLFKIITLPDKFPSKIFKQNKLRIGFDPKLFTDRSLKTFFKKTQNILKPLGKNLIDSIWKNKFKTKVSGFYSLPNKAVGQNFLSKINILTNEIRKKKVDLQFISSSENIAWLLNIRGQDSDFTPIPHSYALIDTEKKINLFCNLNKVNSILKKKLKGVKLVDINYIDQFLQKFSGRKILIDSLSCSIHFKFLLNKKNNIFEYPDPIYLLKSIKNKTEINNIMKSHIYDGVALTKFLFWVKKKYQKQKISELSAQEKLLELREKNKNFQFLSFPTISGTGPNGAIIHYKASKKTNRKLKNGDIYLVDSGGQYTFGTTDVTRTISLNNNNEKIKEIFTRVLKGHIAVASYKIRNNTYGSQIDKAARKSLNEINLDFAHGTGHGVGYFLNVHEGPHAITKNNKVNLREGMIVSNEPGYYKNGKFGIRIENLILVKKYKKNLSFINLTVVPIDKSLIKKSIMKKKEINWLNNYHSYVFKKIKRYMNKSEIIDLKQACSKI